jgi:hypothetical protein
MALQMIKEHCKHVWLWKKHLLSLPTPLLSLL